MLLSRETHKYGNFRMVGPPIPSFLTEQQKLRVEGGRQIWVNADRTRYFTWDYTHGEIECFNKKGRHLGAMHALTGAFMKPAVPGRKINV